MSKRLRLILSLSVVLLFAIVLSLSKVAQPAAPQVLSVKVEQAQVGPHIVAQDPIAGQRLDLSPVLQFTFDRDMDREKTAQAFSLLGPDQKAVAGKADWRDARTMEFTPDAKLEPASTYKAVFSTQAAAIDKTSPTENIELNFTTAENLEVGQVFPAADAEDIDGNTNITVIFNRAVVPLNITEEQGNLPQPLELTPQVKGQGQWVNSSVYVFQPDQPLLSGTRYTVRVGAGLKDTTGNTLDKSFVSQFLTRAPAIDHVALQNGPSDLSLDNVQNVLLDQAFVVTFLQPMDAGSVAKALTITNRETGKPVQPALTWNKDGTVLTIKPSGRYQIASYYTLQIADSAQATDGGTLKEALTVKFSTVPLPQIVSTTPDAGSQAASYDSSLSIKFASPMRLDSLKSRVVISPAPKTPLQWNYNDYDWSYNTYGLEPGTDYVVRILPGMADIYGNTINTGTSFAFTTGDKDPYANLVLPWTPLVYRAKGPQEVYFEDTNLDSATISLYPLTFTEFSKMLNGNSGNKGNGGIATVDFSPQVAPIREWKPDTQGPRNQLNRYNYKLQDLKGNPLQPGNYFIGVKASPLNYTSNFYQGFLFIVATDNITFKATPTEGLAWVTDLETGQPQANVPVLFYDKDFNQVGSGNTDTNGLVYQKGIATPVYVQVKGTNHLAFASLDWGSGVWAGDFGISANFYDNNSTSDFAYLYTDRPVYRPGQDVYFKALVRQNDDLHYSLLKDTNIYATIEQSGEKVYSENLPLSQLGSITGTFKLASDAALGTYTILVRTSETGDPFASLDFRVADYHKPQFQVNAAADKADILAGDKVDFSLDASYYSGGNVGNGNVNWFMDSAPYTFTPAPKFSQYSFIDWDRDQYYYSPQNAGQSGTLAEGQGTTDQNGHLDVPKSVDLGENKTDQQVTFHANVTDVAGDTVSGQTGIIVHQSELYGGIRSLSYVGKQGEAQPFDVVVLDWNSNPVADQSVTVKFVERQWYSVQKQDQQGQLSWVTSVKDIPAGQKTVVTDKDGKANVSFVPSHGGVYKALVTVTDSKGNTQVSSAYTWVSSDQYIAWRQTNDRSFNLIADKDLYAPGDTAELLIAQPFEGSVYALVTYERGHIYKQDVVLLNGNSTVYKLPITSEMAPTSYVSVVVVSGANNTKTPDFKIGMVRLNVDTSQQTLDVKVTADKKSAGPGDNVTYTIVTKDQAGKPVSADVSLAVVDKAALALAPSNSAPILKGFYPDQGLSVQTALGLVSSADDFNAQYRQSIPEGGGSGGGGSDQSLGIITVRQDFKDTAWFQAQATTDANGQAQVTVKLPENLTTWVADARAATAEGRVGQSTQELVSTKPLFVELQTPRFFVAGDQARIGAVVHNNGDAPLTAQVSIDAQGVELITPAAQSVSVPAKSQSYVTWDLNVNPDAQRVDLTAQATSGSFQDSSRPALGTLSGQGIPVYTYSAVETVGTSGMLTSANSATEGIQLPTTYNYSNAQLSIDVSPSLAASMQDSLTYLEDYPYLCMEQTISSFLPNVVSTRALKLAGLSNPTLQSNLDHQVNTALQRIYAKQKPDGGWNWWDGPDSDPQTSAYVVLGLLEAKDAGYTVSAGVLSNGVKYLNDNLPALQANDEHWQYNRSAFILYVLARGNDLQAGQTNFIYEHRSSLDLYGKAYLAQALYMLDPKDQRINSLMSDLAAATVMSAAGAHWEEGSVDYWNWNTDTRTTAIVLNTFVQIDPQNLITANAVRWLMAHREGNHWHSTQETSWTLIALTNWLTASKEFESDYQYAVGLNGGMLQQGQVTKDNLTDTVKLQVQMKDLLKDVVNYVVVTRGGGAGNLYYDAYLSTTLPVASVKPLDQGMSLSRQYFTMDDPKTPITQIARGQLVRVRLTMVVADALHYVVVDDPLPAGLEAIDASIMTDTQVPSTYTVQDYRDRGWGWWYFDHTELRDEKVVLSSDYLPAGTYVYTYLARASTAGTFQVIPPTASEFYFPDVGGRGAGSEFVVKP
jgi:alpha-2-macroglobulin